MADAEISEFAQIGRAYFVGRVIFGIIHITIGSVLLLMLYSVYKSNKGSVTVGSKYFLYTAISIFFSLLTGLIGLFFDNNFIINWDYAAAGRVVTAGDGYAAAFWSTSKFTFYVTFLYHIKHLANKVNESGVSMALLNGVTVFASVMTVCGSLMFAIGDIIIYNPTDELLFVAGFGDNLQMVSFVNDTSDIDNVLRKVGGGMSGVADVVYFLFLMQSYYKLSRTTLSLEIRNEVIRGNVLLFCGSLTTWLFFFSLVNNFRPYFMLAWIDMAFDDCCAVLLLHFSKNGYAVLCRLCNACCGNFYPDKTQYEQVEADQTVNEEREAMI